MTTHLTVAWVGVGWLSEMRITSDEHDDQLWFNGFVSNDGANGVAARRGQGVVTVAPLTSNVERVRPFQVLVPAEASGLDRDSKVQAEQVRSVDVARLSRPVGRISSAVMTDVDAALRLHLGL